MNVRDGITTEADQRHVREILKGLLQANRSATPCGVERMDEGRGASRCRQEQTQAEHEWDTANDGDDRDRPRVVDDNDPDSQALTNGGMTRYRHSWLGSVTCLKIDQTSNLRQCWYVAQWQSLQRATWSVKSIGRYFVGKPRARCWFRWQQSGELEAYSHAVWGSDEAIRRSVSAGVIMNQETNSRSWRCLSAESELYAAVKTAA